MCDSGEGRGVTHVVKRSKVNMGESRLVNMSKGVNGGDTCLVKRSIGVTHAWSRGQM